MLHELRVSNFAIIENLQMTFKLGLNILSGETGAGKSVLLKSLALLMGEKADASAIRSGAEFATVEGRFDLSHRPDICNRLLEMGIEVGLPEGDQEMVVRRIVAHGAKARVYINGSLSTLSALRDVVSPLVEVTGHAAPLIEMTGQHDNRNLLARSYHLELIDQYAGTTKLRQDFHNNFSRFCDLQREQKRIREQDQDRALKLDFLRFQREEINALELRAGDEVAIESEAKRMKHSSRLLEMSHATDQILDGGDDSVLSKLHGLLAKAHDLRHLDPELPAKLSPLHQAQSLIRDVVFEIREYGQNLDSDPEKLDLLESRLSRLRHLQKKYGSTAIEILETQTRIETEIRSLEQSDARLSQIQTEILRLSDQLQEKADQLHQRREEASRLFAKEVNLELEDLNMKGVHLTVQVQRLTELQQTGSSDIEFMIQNSKSDHPRPFGKVASGGELSRILLSIKQIVGTSAHPRTYLFDEVDTGVSGETAERVGQKLRSIAQGQQVIGVTHLPQVASVADVHFFIRKQVSDQSSSMQIQELTQEERVKEIARLISGQQVTPTSLAHARQLLGLKVELVEKNSEKKATTQDKSKLKRKLSSATSR